MVCSIISYTHWNKGYRKVFSLITTVLDYSASARERQMTKLSLIDKILVTKNSFKHVQCFYQVKETRVHVGEREMLWEQKPTGLFPQLFLVLPNSHDYFYNSIAASIALQTIFIYVYRLHADGGTCVTTWRQFLFSFFTLSVLLAWWPSLISKCHFSTCYVNWCT